LGGVAADRAAGERQARDAIASGAGLERFRRIIQNQGGDPRVVDDYGRLPAAPSRHVVTASRAGYLTHLDAESIGRASVSLGAGRDRVEDAVDPAVGIVVLPKVGDQVRAGDPILELHYRDQAKLDQAIGRAASAIAIGDSPPPLKPLIAGEVH